MAQCVASSQGLTLIHFSAQLERFVWNRGCIQGGVRGCSGGIRGYCGVCGVYFVSETAQVELKTGRVSAPASSASARCTLDTAMMTLLSPTATTPVQGLTLVHVRAQLEQLQETLVRQDGFNNGRRAHVELKWERV